MMIYLGADHGGFELKEKLKVWFLEDGIVTEDLGAYSLNPEDDYPNFIVPVAEKVASDPESIGIILGRSGNGEAMAANKVDGVRAAVCLNVQMAKKARQDNNANVLSLGADFVDFEQAKEIVKTFLETSFSGRERHVRRLQQMEKVENAN